MKKFSTAFPLVAERKRVERKRVERKRVEPGIVALNSNARLVVLMRAALPPGPHIPQTCLPGFIFWP